MEDEEYRYFGTFGVTKTTPCCAVAKRSTNRCQTRCQIPDEDILEGLNSEIDRALGTGEFTSVKKAVQQFLLALACNSHNRQPEFFKEKASAFARRLFEQQRQNTRSNEEEPLTKRKRRDSSGDDGSLPFAHKPRLPADDFEISPQPDTPIRISREDARVLAHTLADMVFYPASPEGQNAQLANLSRLGEIFLRISCNLPPGQVYGYSMPNNPIPSSYLALDPGAVHIGVQPITPPPDLAGTVNWNSNDNTPSAESNTDYVDIAAALQNQPPYYSSSPMSHDTSSDPIRQSFTPQNAPFHNLFDFGEAASAHHFAAFTPQPLPSSLSLQSHAPQANDGMTMIIAGATDSRIQMLPVPLDPAMNATVGIPATTQQQQLNVSHPSIDALDKEPTAKKLDHALRFPLVGIASSLHGSSASNTVGGKLDYGERCDDFDLAALYDGVVPSPL